MKFLWLKLIVSRVTTYISKGATSILVSEYVYQDNVSHSDPAVEKFLNSEFSGNCLGTICTLWSGICKSNIHPTLTAVCAMGPRLVVS